MPEDTDKNTKVWVIRAIEHIVVGKPLGKKSFCSPSLCGGVYLLKRKILTSHLNQLVKRCSLGTVFGKTSENHFILIDFSTNLSQI